VHLRGHPAPGWLACRAAARFVSGGYHEEDFEVWDSAGTLVAQSRQLAMILPLGLRVSRLCVYASRLRNRTAPTTSRIAMAKYTEFPTPHMSPPAIAARRAVVVLGMPPETANTAP